MGEALRVIVVRERERGSGYGGEELLEVVAGFNKLMRALGRHKRFLRPLNGGLKII
jgi:hypothetical protein